MKTVILTRDMPNHVALCHKVAAEVDVMAIVVSENVPRRPPQRPYWRLLHRVLGRLVGRPLHDAWREIQLRYRQTYPALPLVETVQVANINDLQTVATLERLDPDLVVVSGTNLVGRRVIEVAARRRGVLNLHTGISPYIKGGPNCTNWCLAEGLFHLIGNTVMWLDPGIDTGPLVATERTPLSGEEGLADLHWQVMEHGHDLLVRTLKVLTSGGILPHIPQDQIATGRTFYTDDWTAAKIMSATHRFCTQFSPANVVGHLIDERLAEIQLFPLS